MRSYLALSGILIFLISIVVASSSESSSAGNEIDQEEPTTRNLARCVSESDCAKNECSVMGMQRYAEPRCELRGSLGAPCRVGAEAENRTLHFPHQTMECDMVYLQFCPCAEGLVCDRAECRRPRRYLSGAIRPSLQGGNRLARERLLSGRQQRWEQPFSADF